MTHYLAAGETWGIASGEFLLLYLVLCFFSVGIALIARGASGDRGRRIAVLSPVEVGMLVSDGNAVLAAIAQLRVAGVIDADGTPVRAITREDRTTLDWFVRSVGERIASGSTSLVRDLQTPLRQLRSDLVRDGLLRRQPRSAWSALLLLPVIILGFARLGAGLANGRPVGFLVLAMLAMGALFLYFAFRTRRRTAAGRRELEAARQRNAHLHPRLQPSMRTYGPQAAAYGAALFGVASLMLFDPVLAATPAAAQAAAMTPAFTIGGGTGSGSSCSSGSSFSSCSSGSSCGSSSSSSSSCGGGGCGG
ncbi:TIGR04222 domain-containing membrane protein [Tsukamurella sp. NPDC003166]|uniref:TIGR04222 domain-containing membrane protein n=1 Tax=Tsukamurella sp. NPDC003166 TaxID=3154444 RepID=UPI0033AFAD3D